jgi:hypothetical protein
MAELASGECIVDWVGSMNDYTGIPKMVKLPRFT